MIDERFVFVGLVIALLGSLHYARDVLRGDTSPNRVTWILWTIAPMVAFAAELTEGAGLTSVLTLSVGAGPLVVLAASFANRQAVWELTRLDYACGTLALAGIAGWLATRHGGVAIVLSIAADFAAGIPTFTKAWSHPRTESANVFVAGVLNAAITLLTVQEWNVATAAFPAYVLATSSVLALLVASRIGPRAAGRDDSGCRLEVGSR